MQKNTTGINVQNFVPFFPFYADETLVILPPSLLNSAWSMLPLPSLSIACNHIWSDLLEILLAKNLQNRLALALSGSIQRSRKDYLFLFAKTVQTSWREEITLKASAALSRLVEPPSLTTAPLTLLFSTYS